jgi:hypothetical protein
MNYRVFAVYVKRIISEDCDKGAGKVDFAIKTTQTGTGVWREKLIVKIIESCYLI